jgi:hypothetical protein
MLTDKRDNKTRKQDFKLKENLLRRLKSNIKLNFVFFLLGFLSSSFLFLSLSDSIVDSGLNDFISYNKQKQNEKQNFDDITVIKSNSNEHRLAVVVPFRDRQI